MAKGASRDRRREVRWRGIMREQDRSGLSIRGFCRKSKLPETAFYYWRSELQRRQAEHVSGVASAKPEEQRRPQSCVGQDSGAAPVPTFVPVRVEEQSTASPAGGRIEIVLPGGRRVHVTAPVDRQALADVLAVLAGAEGGQARAAERGDLAEGHQC